MIYLYIYNLFVLLWKTHFGFELTISDRQLCAQGLGMIRVPNILIMVHWKEKYSITVRLYVWNLEYLRLWSHRILIIFTTNRFQKPWSIWFCCHLQGKRIFKLATKIQKNNNKKITKWWFIMCLVHALKLSHTYMLESVIYFLNIEGKGWGIDYLE